MSAREEVLSQKDYVRVCALIYDAAGIHLGTERKHMLEARIYRRLKALRMTSYSDYCTHLFRLHEKHGGAEHDEIVQLIDVVTTNKTDFFREPRHFDFLTQTGLRELMQRRKSIRPLLIWSAGCSTGEEPYTLAMLLSEYASNNPGFQFRILATDISTAVLNKASHGIFSSADVRPVPMIMQRKYLMRSRKRDADLVRIVPELRRCVDFRRLNFMDDDYGIREKADAIFCRNVIIYFDRATQQRMLLKLVNLLVPGGFLFVGHAETLHEMNLPIEAIAPATYRRLDG
jgi:chemotaxis protein methyltransferase CheR